MLNIFRIKKMAALVLPGLICTIMYAVGGLYYGLLGGVGFMLLGLLLSYLIGRLLLDNPFRAMLEGKGLLVIDLNSTGILRPFIMNIDLPYIKGKNAGKHIEDVFDRDAVHYLTPPTEIKSVAKLEKRTFKMSPKKKGDKPLEREITGVNFFITERDFNNGRFGLNQFPVIIWNSALHSVLTKEFLSMEEKNSFAKHGVLYLNRKVEELTSHMRDFGRYVVDSLRPGLKVDGKKIMLIILIIGVVVLLALFAPKLIAAIKGGGAGAVSAVSTAVGGNPITVN